MPRACLFKVKCDFCGKKIIRSLGRINESKKFHWKTFCSTKCGSNAKSRQILVRCSRPNCRKLFKRKKSEFKKSELHYCSCSCAISVNNSRFPKRLAEIKICAFCGKDFKSREKYCSRPCKDKGSIISAEELILKIRTFVKKCGRIPFKREMLNYHAFRSRFGTWNNAISVAGFDPNPVMFANKHIANDGHNCDSLSEKIVDDWLFARKIEHKRNVHYPGKDGLTVDFLINNHWIEFFGLRGEHKRYDELMEKKLKIAEKYRLKLTEIYPEDLFPKNRLSERFKFLKY